MNNSIVRALALLFALMIILTAASCKGNSGSGENDSGTSEKAVSEVTSDNVAGKLDTQTSSGSESSSASETESASQSNPDKPSSSDTDNTNVPDVPETDPLICLTATVSGNEVQLDCFVLNNPGIACFDFAVNYDKTVLTPEKFSEGLVNVVSNVQSSLLPVGYITAVHSSATAFKENGRLFSVTFKAAEGKTKDVGFTLTAPAVAFIDSDAKNITFKYRNASVSLGSTSEE